MSNGVREGDRLFESKKSFGEPYACNQTTALALLTNSIRGRAARESENRSLLRQEKEKLQPSSVEAFLGGVSEMKVELSALYNLVFNPFSKVI